MRRSGDHSRLRSHPCPPFLLPRASTPAPAATCCPATSASSPSPAAGRTPTSQRLGVEPEVTLRCGDLPYAATYDISEKILARLHPGLSAPALLSVVRLPRWTPAEVLRPDARLLLVADGIEYAGNLGTLVRTADAAGADGLVLTNATCRLTHPKVFEASRGTVLTLPTLEYGSVADARRDLAAAGFTAYVADPAAATPYLDVDYAHRMSRSSWARRATAWPPSGAPPT